MVVYNMWFTDLLHICDNISHLQTELVILFLRIVKQNHCFCCEGMCVLVVVEEEEGVDGKKGQWKDDQATHTVMYAMYYQMSTIPIIELINTL